MHGVRFRTEGTKVRLFGLKILWFRGLAFSISAWVFLKPSISDGVGKKLKADAFRFNFQHLRPRATVWHSFGGLHSMSTWNV